MGDIDIFAEAFSPPIGSCEATCHCGQKFYNPDDTWDFEDDELGDLEASDAIAIDHSIKYVYLEGREYVASCKCWKERAEMVMAFLDGHAYGIAEYLNESKKAAQRAANVMPEVTP